MKLLKSLDIMLNRFKLKNNMLNKEDYVSLEIAKFLKEKGFNELCGYYFHTTGVLHDSCHQKMSNSQLLENWVSCPSLYQVQKWLRDKHNIHITIGNSASGYWWELSKTDNGTTIYDYNYSGPNDGGKWDTYEDALSFGILEALKRI